MCLYLSINQTHFGGSSIKMKLWSSDVSEQHGSQAYVSTSFRGFQYAADADLYTPSPKIVPYTDIIEGEEFCLLSLEEKEEGFCRFGSR